MVVSSYKEFLVITIFLSSLLRIACADTSDEGIRSRLDWPLLGHLVQSQKDLRMNIVEPRLIRDLVESNEAIVILALPKPTDLDPQLKALHFRLEPEDLKDVWETIQTNLFRLFGNEREKGTYFVLDILVLKETALIYLKSDDGIEDRLENVGISTGDVIVCIPRRCSW